MTDLQQPEQPKPTFAALVEKIAAASQYVVVPTLALYMLGFLCINAFLSRFGIVDFDIVNARYLIAGVFPMFGLCISLTAGWILFTDTQKSYESENRWLHVLAYVKFGSNILAASFLFEIFLAAGRIKERVSLSLMDGPPLGEYDVIGRIASSIVFDSSIDGLLIIQWTVYFLAYVLLFIAIVVLIKNLGSSSKGATKEKPAKPPARKLASFFGGLALYAATSIVLAVYLGLMWYSIAKIRANLADFDSIVAPPAPDFGLTFAWLFSNSIVVLLVAKLAHISVKSTDPIAIAGHAIKKDFVVTGAFFIVPVITHILSFGAAIFPHIPVALGGGEPRPALLFRSAADDPTQVILLGEGSDFVYAIGTQGNRYVALQISKSEIQSLQMKDEFISDPSHAKIFGH